MENIVSRVSRSEQGAGVSKKVMKISREAIERQEISISVIVPAYNAREHIIPCLDALRNSNYENHEILVVDDCSSDGTVELLHDMPCRVLKTEKRSGPGGARNMGILNARGEVILFVDADIVVTPTTMTELLESFLERPDIASVTGDYDIGSTYHNLSSLYQKLYNEYKREFLPRFGPYINTAIFCIPAATIKAIGGLRDHICTGEDYELGIRLTTMGYLNYFNRAVRVMHNKHVTLSELIRQKMQYATNLVMVKQEIEKEGDAQRIDLEKTFSVAIDQILAVLLSGLTVVIGILSAVLRSPVLCWAALLFFLGYCLSNLRYWTFLFRAAGLTACLLLPLSFLEQLISLFAIIAGMIRFRFRLPYLKFRGIQ